MSDFLSLRLGNAMSFLATRESDASSASPSGKEITVVSRMNKIATCGGNFLGNFFTSRIVDEWTGENNHKQQALDVTN